MIKYYLLLIVMTLVGAIASFFLKKASKSQKILELIKNYNLYIGGFLYLLSAVLNIYLNQYELTENYSLKYLDYSLVLPMTSITYIWTLIISYRFLNEKIGLKKICGVFIIIAGVILLAL